MQRILTRAIADHRHQRHDTGAAAEQQNRAAVGDLPDKMPADRSAQLDVVADRGDVVEEGRDLAVVEPLDGKLERRAATSGAEAIE